MSTYGDAKDFLKQGVKDNAFYRCLSYGILFSFIVTLIIGDFIGSFSLDKDFPYVHAVGPQQYWAGIVFISFSLLFAFFGYFNDLKARDDILTPIRKKLVGTWRVKYSAWVIEGDEIKLSELDDVCKIGIDTFARKLFIHFQMRNSDVFVATGIDITSVHIQYQTNPNKLIYFHDNNLQLKEPLIDGKQSVAGVQIPIVGVLTFNIENDKIDSMTGMWYDIDNAIYNLALKMPNLTGIDRMTERLSQGGITFKGHIEFTRFE